MTLPGDSLMRLMYFILLLAVLGGWAFVELRRDLARTVKTALAWGLIILGLMALYGLWGDIRGGVRVNQRVEAGSVTLPRSPDGHYYARLTISGQDIVFMADTGASDVVLTPADAGRVGIDPQHLAFVGMAGTANGMVRTAEVRLDDVTFGPFHDTQIQAAVNEAPMDVSLLGMSYLGRFQITIAGNEMVLKR